MGLGKAAPKSSLRIKRILQAFQAIASFEAVPGMITILTDTSDANLKALEATLSNKSTQERFSFELDSNTLEPQQQCKVGFDESLPVGMSLPEYLKDNGVPEDRVDAILESFELKKYCYLNCAQLPFNQARQLFLIGACYSSIPVVFLNDPFLPFSGRWREVFAELLLKQVEAQNKIVVILNLSFPPQCWGKSDRICSIDIGQVVEKAITKATQVAKEQAEAEKIEKLAKQAETAREENPYYARKVVFVLPEKFTFAFRQTTDFIFEPMARVVTFFRSYSGAIAISGCAFLVLLMGFVMLPGLSEKRAMLREMASNFHYKWSDFVSQKPEQPKTQIENDQVKKEEPKDLVQPEVNQQEAAPVDGAVSNPIDPIVSPEAGAEANSETAFSKFTTQSFSLCLEPVEKNLAPEAIGDFKYEYEGLGFCEPDAESDLGAPEDLNPVSDKE